MATSGAPPGGGAGAARSASGRGRAAARAPRPARRVPTLAGRGRGLAAAAAPRARRAPAWRRRSASVAIGALAIALVHHQQVGDLEQPGLERLHLVAEPGRRHHHHGVGRRRPRRARPAPRPRSPPRSPGSPRRRARPRTAVVARDSPPWCPRVAERADEDAVIGGVAAHPHAIAEQRAAAERAGGIDGHHADPLAARARYGATSADDQRRLADAGAAGDADDEGAPAPGIDLRAAPRARPAARRRARA